MQFSKIFGGINPITFYCARRVRWCSCLRWDRKCSRISLEQRTRLSLVTIFREARCTFAIHPWQNEIISTAKSILDSDTDLIAIVMSNLHHLRYCKYRFYRWNFWQRHQVIYFLPKLSIITFYRYFHLYDLKN